MSTLTKAQKDQIISKESTRGADYIFNAIQKYENLSLSDFSNMDSRKREYIQKKIDELPPMPNSVEQAEWNEIQDSIGQGAFNPTAIDTRILQMLQLRLNSYIANWEASLPICNHVDDARLKNNAISQELADRQARQEAIEWLGVDKNSETELRGYLNNHPSSIHRNEIDGYIWNLTDKGDEKAVKNYLNDFPNGLHSSEANDIANEYVSWNNVVKYDIFAVNKYMNDNPMSPLIVTVKSTLNGLKNNEIWEMKTNPNTYNIAKFPKLIDEGIFTKEELVNAGVAPMNVINTLLNPTAWDGLDILTAIRSSSASCRDRYTDVYFFGIPSTGKTCILMGLMRSGLLVINNAASGGNYADQLTLHCQRGIVVDRTPGTFTTTIEATMFEKDNNKIKHGINLVEMSGEEFAFQIAKNPNQIVSFADMGGDVATKLLKNNNRKVFFLIIDPTTDDVSIRRNMPQVDSQGDPVKDSYGNQIVSTVTASANQTLILQRMINLFKADENAEIMKKVDSLHIIVTKADTLGGSKNERNNNARRIFNNKFSGPVLQELKGLCKTYNINSNTDFSPKLYTFSLGNFYIGGLFGYDRSDTDLLVKAIRNSTGRIKAETFWDKVKRTCN